MEELKLARARRTWIPYAVLAIALLLTASATYYVAMTVRAKDRLRFENAVQSRHDDIQNRLETYITLLRAGSGLFAANNQVSRDEFRTFVDRLQLQQNYPGIQGIGFSARVMPKEKEALIIYMQKQGVKNFALRPGYKRNQYHSIIYLEPLDRRNQVTIGFDMFTEPMRRAAMERARDTGIPAASSKVTLLQEIDKQKQAGFLIYFPVYRNGSTLNTVIERRAALIGFIYSPFRVDDLLKGILRNQTHSDIDFQIYDGSSVRPENLLHRFHRNSSTNSKAERPYFTTTTTIDVAGRTWSVVFASQPEFDRVSERSLVPYIAVGGLIISFLLFGVTWLQVRDRLIAERTAADLHCSEKALRESELRLRNILDSLFSFVAVLSPDGIVLEVNRAPLNLAALQPEDVLGKPLVQAYWWSYSPSIQSQIQAAIKQAIQGENSRFDIQARIAGDNLITIDFCLIPVFDSVGICYLVASGIDVTQRKQAETELRHALAKEKELGELKSRFINMASHEFRTPLATILSSTELLEHYSHKWTEEKRNNHFQRIQAAVKHMTGLLNDVLLIGKAEAGKLQLQLKPLNLVQYCWELVEETQLTVNTHTINFRTQGECNACMDEKLLRHIFSNLLSNAIKYSPAGTTVDFELNCKQGEAIFLVRDRGIGIPVADQAQLFNPFHRASNVGTISGTGLGLAIVKKSVDLHGGQIVVNSNVDVGTTFIVTLPLKKEQVSSHEETLLIKQESSV